MCLGADARAANEAARRDYEYKLEKRERNWMQTLSMTNVEHLQYEQGIDASNLGLAHTITDLQGQRSDIVDRMVTESQADWKEFLAKNTGDQLKASGRLGRSSERISAIDLGQYLKKGSDKVHALSKADAQLNKQAAQAAGQARAEQMQMFTNVAFVKNPDMVPPKPVYRNVGLAAFKDALSIATSAATIYAAVSDRRLKENIIKLGESISGLGIYKFNYIGKAKQYIGTMADEVIKIFPKAAILNNNGFYAVDYSVIDVEFKEVHS